MDVDASAPTASATRQRIVRTSSIVRQVARRIETAQVRQATSRLRALPDFLILGAPKSGTTSLHYWLRQHPGVVPATAKELHYFDKNLGQGDRWYRAQFPLRMVLGGVSVRRRLHAITGEATPSYLRLPGVRDDVARLTPDARFVVILRDPTQRAYSDYRMEVRSGREHRTFRDALLAPEHQAQAQCECAHLEYPADWTYRSSHVTRGLYAQQLAHWFERFPRRQFLILEFGALAAASLETYREVLDFLGLPFVPAQFRAVNVDTTDPSATDSAPDPALLAALDEQFAEPNHRLRDLVGVEFA